MGKKSIKLFGEISLYIGTVIAALFSLLGLFSATMSPVNYPFSFIWTFLLPVILFINLLLFIYWVIKLKFWALIPLCAIFIHYGSITAVLQFTKHQQKTEGLITAATYNVHNFKYNKYKHSVEEIAYELSNQNANIICLQEFAENNKYNLDSVKVAFDKTPYLVFGETEKNRGYGLVILSKWPILRWKNIYFKSKDNNAMWADININGKIIRVFNIHLQTTQFSQSSNNNMINIVERLQNNSIKRAQQLDLIYSIIDTTKTPILLCGDFNDTPSSYTYNKISKVLDDGFKSGGSGYEYTYRYIRQLLRIDYIFHSNDFKGLNYYSLDFPYSDHNPVIMTLDLESAKN